MRPTRGLGHRPGSSIGLVQGVVAGVGIGLEDAGIAGQVPVRVLGRSVARVAEHCRRGCRPAEGPVVADMGPDPPRDGLARASTGTVVSSPCSRSAARTWASIRALSGAGLAVLVPTQSAM